MDRVMPYTAENYCIKCNTHNVECFDSYNNPINLSNLIILNKNNKKINLNNKQLIYMRCKKCGNKYNIVWKNNHNLPFPCYNNIDIEIFLEGYFNF